MKQVGYGTIQYGNAEVQDQGNKLGAVGVDSNVPRFFSLWFKQCEIFHFPIAE